MIDLLLSNNRIAVFLEQKKKIEITLYTCRVFQLLESVISSVSGKSMKVYHGSYLIFYISGKKLKVKEITIRIWSTAIFVFSCLIALKIAASVEIACSCKGKC